MTAKNFPPCMESKIPHIYLPVDPTLIQLNPVHILTLYSYFSKINFNISLQSIYIYKVAPSSGFLTTILQICHFSNELHVSPISSFLTSSANNIW